MSVSFNISRGSDSGAAAADHNDRLFRPDRRGRLLVRPPMFGT